MERLSDVEASKRQLAKDFINQLNEDVKQQKIQIANQFEQLIEKERIHRLQADQASAPLYAEAVMICAVQYQSINDIVKTFRQLYKSRSQSTHAQQLISEIMKDYLLQHLKDLSLQIQLDVLEQVTSLMKGSIYIENVFIELEMQYIDCLVRSHNISAAAQHAEQLQTDTASSLDFEQKLKFILQQFQTVALLKNNTRSQLIFQKYNDELVTKQKNPEKFAKLREEINLEMASTYFSTKNLEKLATCWFRAGCATNDASSLEKALVASYAQQNKDLIAQILTHPIKLQCALRDIIEANKILNVQEIQQVNCYGLENEVLKGFVIHQLEKISKAFKVITFSKLNQFLGVKIEDIEVIIAEGNVAVQIDREEQIFSFASTKPKNQSHEMLKGVLDVAYQIYTIENEK